MNDERPFRRMLAFLGLLGLVPIAYMLAVGDVSLGDAAMRASVTMGAVLVLDRLSSWSWQRAVDTHERQVDRREAELAGDGR